MVQENWGIECLVGKARDGIAFSIKVLSHTGYMAKSSVSLIVFNPYNNPLKFRKIV